MLFFSIQVLSTDEESVGQSLFTTSPQSRTKCGENEVCEGFEIHCSQRKCFHGDPLKVIKGSLWKIYRVSIFNWDPL